MLFLLTSVLACQLMATWLTSSGSGGRVSDLSPSPEPTLLSSLSLREPSELTNSSPWRTMSTWRSESREKRERREWEEGGGGGTREGERWVRWGGVRRTWYLIWLLSVMYKGYDYGELWNKHDHYRERGWSIVPAKLTTLMGSYIHRSFHRSFYKNWGGLGKAREWDFKVCVCIMCVYVRVHTHSAWNVTLCIFPDLKDSNLVSPQTLCHIRPLC